MTLLPTEECDLDLAQGGPFRRLQERVGLIRNGFSIPRRIAWAVAVTWVPLLVLSLLQGRALGSTPRESFLLDFATHARFLLTLPLLIAAEAIVGPRLASAGKFFARAGLVRPQDGPAFEKAVARLVRWRDSGWAEAILLAIALVGSWTANFEKWYGVGPLTWRILPTEGGERLSLAGLWFHAAALPVLQFLWLRWLWRLVVWARFLYSISRLDLDLVPTHADGAGGLGFLGTDNAYVGFLACALGWSFSGDVAFRLFYEGAKLATFQAPVAIYLLACLMLFLAPLLVFVPALVRARREGLKIYSRLVDDYNRAFHKKWTQGPPPEPEALLGSPDIQSMAGLAANYDRVRQMRPLPFGGREVMQILVLALLPALPLVLIVVPVGDILDFLGKALF